jgi:hypothetical protein
MKRHRSPADGETVPRPAARARPRGAVIGATLVAAALLVAACSSASSGPQVASLGGHRSGGSAAPNRLTTAQSDRDMLNFTRCMRAHGVNMPDPVHIPGHTGLSLEFPGATPSPNTRAATAACTHFIQPIIQAKQAGAAAALSPARLAALTSYARCMRAHDIPMLDPTSFGALNLGRVPGISSDFGRYSPQLRTADAACRHLLPAGVHDDGTGP